MSVERERERKREKKRYGAILKNITLFQGHILRGLLTPTHIEELRTALKMLKQCVDNRCF